jgi:hypothetical protein
MRVIHDKLISTLTPQGLSTLYMALAMATNFFGYEFARSANLSLFTSIQYGFSSPAAFPIAMACVSPFSVLLLLGYVHMSSCDRSVDPVASYAD